MPSYDAIVPAFNGGEWSGRMRGRVDLEAYKRALALARNVEPFVQGSARKRPGTKHLTVLAGADSTVRLATLRTAKVGDFCVALTDLGLAVYNPDGTPAIDGGGNQVANGDFSLAGAYWTALPGRAPANFTSGRAYFETDPAVNTPAAIVQATGPYVAEDLAFSVALEITNTATSNGRLRVRLGTTSGGTELHDSGWLTSADNGTYTANLVAVTGTVYVTIEGDRATEGGAVWGTTWADDVSLTMSGGGVVTFAAPWASGDLSALQWAEDTGHDRLVFVHGGYEPRILQRSAAGTWSLGVPTWTAKPATWTGSNWPSVVEVYQGRLWLGAPPDARTTFWGSKSGDFFNFTIGNSPGDAFSYIAATKNALSWMRGQRAMLMGAANADLSITAASVIVGPGDIDVKEESAFGSAPIMAEKAGNEVLYASSDRTKVRALQHDERLGWLSEDITDMSEHLFTDLVDEIHYGRDPNSSVVVVLKSGELRICTYDKPQKVRAWWRWDTLPGLVYSAAVTYAEGGASLWLAVGGRQAGEVHLEKMPLGEPADVQYLDAHKVVSTDGSIGITGMTHLAGKTVQVVLDGSVEPTTQVISGGGLGYLSRVVPVGRRIVVGLPYTSEMQPLAAEGGNPAGTAQGMKKRRPEIWVRLNNSALPLINGRRPRPQRSAGTPMGSAEPLFTGDVKVTDRGITGGADVLIEMDLPLRTEVCAIFGTVQQDKV